MVELIVYDHSCNSQPGPQIVIRVLSLSNSGCGRCFLSSDEEGFSILVERMQSSPLPTALIL